MDGDSGTTVAVAGTLGGLLPVKNLRAMLDAEKQEAESAQREAPLPELARHVRAVWTTMLEYRRREVEPRLLACLRQRRGEYSPEDKAQLARQAGSDIYMMLSSNKARAVSSWIRDVYSSSREGPLPYYLAPTPVPEVSPDRVEAEMADMQDELARLLASGVRPTRGQIDDFVDARRRMVENAVMEEATEAVGLMKRRMDDQLVEGGAREEFDRVIDDLSTFPFAMICGPEMKRRKTLSWVPSPTGGYEMSVGEEIIPTWRRVDPFMVYWLPHAVDVDDGDIIERMQMTTRALHEMIGVEGNDDAAIRAVLDEYGAGGLREWLWGDSQRAEAEGRSEGGTRQEGLIDALKYVGHVMGGKLAEWGLEGVDDLTRPYLAEVWLVGSWVIRACLCPDPLERKNYYKTSFEVVPGLWMGNSPMDLIRDCQAVCNACARALVSNLGIASGPQVWVNIDRLPDGEATTELYPWKIHQTVSDPLGSSSAPMGFFQPASMAAELLSVYERFSAMADEYSGVPRYMTGETMGGGAGRTASGMSMMMNNAGKSIKQVVSNIDRMVEKLVERLWYHNMRYSDDPEMLGDVKIVARGANALLVKEAATARRNEMLQMVLTSPLAQQIVGMDGAAHLLREQARALDMNADKIVPSPDVMRARAMLAQAMMPPVPPQPAGVPPAMPTPPAQTQGGVA